MQTGIYSKVTLILVMSVSLPYPGSSQNLVPNHSFEEYDECPTNNMVGGEPLPAIPWVQGNLASADYFHVCGPPDEVGVPLNQWGFQWPYVGEAYVGGYARRSGDSYREYVMAPLLSPLISGRAYLVSFYVSLADDGYCGITPFGALFTIDPPEPNGIQGDQNLLYTPQIEVNGGYLSDYNDWMLISRCFIAQGGEQYITIGNFRNLDETPVDPDCDNLSMCCAYYYIDEVSVIEMPLSEDEFALDPVTACGSHTINPGQAENYLWEDGTTNPTLTVTESGIYYVTLSDACAFSYGEIEVTILPDAPPVALPNDTILCTAESLSIALDPDAGEYVWEDGTIGPDLTISTEGVYIVTLTDDCDMTSDTIQVDFLDAPEFSLGADTAICDGDAFTISLDPALGDFIWQDGSTNTSYTIDEDGTYILTITNICGQVADTTLVEFWEPLDFSIGPDQLALCEGEEYEIELDPDLGDFLWIDGSSDNTYTITGEGLVSVQVTNACETASDEMLVNVFLPPQFTLGPDLTVCEGQFPLTFDFSDVDHAQSYEWTDGSGQSIYQISAPGIYGLTISNDCFAETDSIEITVADSDPVVTLPSDQLLCHGDSMLLQAGGVQGEYLWLSSTGAMTDTVGTGSTYMASDSGSYVLQVTNICGTGADTIVIAYTAPLQSPDLGADFSLCPGETAILYAGVSGVSYAWQDTSTGMVSDADSLLISGPGMYILEIADQCATASDTIVVTQDGSPPIVDLPETINLCEGDTVIIDAGISGVEYLWQDSSVASEFIATMSGIYHIQVSNACGTDSDTTIVLDSGPPPFVELGPDTAMCAEDTFVIIPDFSDVESWLWQDGTVEPQNLAALPGIYHVLVSNTCGQVSDTLVVGELPDVPALDLGSDIALCPGESETLSIDIQDVEIQWSDNSIGNDFEVNAGGLIFATISNACGSSSDTISITMLDAVPVLDLGEDQSLCPGETITIDPGIPDVEYLWYDTSTSSVSTSSTIAVDSPATIVLTISNECGSASDTIDIILDPNGPEVDLGPDILACEGDTIVLDAGISGVDYLWQDSSVAARFIASQSGEYHVQVSNACGTDSDTILVDIHGTAPTPSLGSDTTLCNGEILTLVSDADAETSVEWLNLTTGAASTGSATVADESGTYILFETNHCGFASDTIAIDFVSAPAAFDLGQDLVICPGDTVILHAPQTTDAILWETPGGTSTGAATVVTQPGLVTLSISNDCGIASDEMMIAFDPNEPEVALDPVSFCEGESVVLDVTQPFDADYLWNTGSTSSVLQVVEAGDYHVSVMTDCYLAEGSVEVTESDDCESGIYIPNVFSPNYDYVNDFWEVQIDPGLEFTSIECSVYDRWGNIVFRAELVPIVWDGTFKGSTVLPGVYVYVVRLINEDETRTLSGSLTLVR